MKKLLNIIMGTLLALAVIDAANISLAALKQNEKGGQMRNIQITEDIKSDNQRNLHFRLIPLNRASMENRSQLVKYFLGSRVNGDRLVEQYADSFFYSNPVDVFTNVTYPQKGTGSVVTYIEINCLQENGDGNAYIMSGGIGERFITIGLEAKQTERFAYNAHIYGKY